MSMTAAREAWVRGSDGEPKAPNGNGGERWLGGSTRNMEGSLGRTDDNLSDGKKTGTGVKEEERQ